MAEPKNRRRTSPRSGSKPTAPEPATNGDEPVPTDTGGVWIEMLDPNVIRWPESRITSEYDEEKTVALRQSMAEVQHDAVGVVLLEDGTYEGSAGYNRCMAAVANGAAKIRCEVRHGSRRDVVMVNIANAVNQSKPNPLSEVEGIANAYYNEGVGIEDLVRTAGRNSDWVEARILISQASPAVKQRLGEGTITIGHATLLANVEDQAVQEQALGLLMARGWTVRELGEYLLSGNREVEPRATRAPRTPQGPKPCNCCKVELAPAELLTVTVCTGCAGRLGPDAVLVREGEVAVPVELLREAERLLAGSQASAPLAERIGTFLESGMDAGLLAGSCPDINPDDLGDA